VCWVSSRGVGMIGKIVGGAEDGQRRIDIGPERALKSLPLSQTHLHAIERRSRNCGYWVDRPTG